MGENDLDVCKYCKSYNMSTREKVFSNNTKHIELYCGDCGKHQRYLSQSEDIIIHFGKYKGQKLEGLVKADPDYCMWLLKNGNVKGRVKRFLENTFKDI